MNYEIIRKTFQVTFKSPENFAGPPSWGWAAAWGEILAIFLSFSSLLLTAIRYRPIMTMIMIILITTSGTIVSPVQA